MMSIGFNVVRIYWLNKGSRTVIRREHKLREHKLLRPAAGF